MRDTCELTILMPCLDEAATLGACIEKAQGFLCRTGIAGEVLIADNGSGDGSPGIAENLGARVVRIARRGYGTALSGGIRAARGRYVIVGDADDSYDFTRLDAFIQALREGFDLVMGNRFRGGILPGAMPPLRSARGQTTFAAFAGNACLPAWTVKRGLSPFRYVCFMPRSSSALLGVALQS